MANLNGDYNEDIETSEIDPDYSEDITIESQFPEEDEDEPKSWDPDN